MKRLEIIKKLVKNPGDLNVFREELENFPWDYKGEKVILTRNDIIKLYSNNLNNYDYISIWADLIELRDDITYEEGYQNLISDLIFTLSTPEINGKITFDEIKNILF